MKFASSYKPEDFETDIYAAWEAAGKFLPKTEEELAQKGPAKGADAGAGGSGGSDGSTGGSRKVKRAKKFSIVLPPPNANGNLHIGHGLTVAIEDSLARYYRLRGQRTWYVPGADHAGFETWVVYERELEKNGHTRFEYSRDELYTRVWDFVAQQRGNMELQLRALGASCSWKDLTFTLDENVVRRVYTTFEKMWKDGMVYRGEKLVNFCTKHQTAFADIEVEHEEEDGKLWDIAYPYDDGEIIVSTTRPETLFGDAAVAVNPGDKRYEKLVGKTVKLPLTRREIPVVADEHADPEYGTGAVKITPAHDYDDFEVGMRHGLPRIRVIGFDGRMEGICGPEYAGLTTVECRKKVLKDLEDQGLLRGEHKIRHAVAHCYKCGTVIEPMLKSQWFVNTEKLAEEAISHLEAGEIKFFPASKGKVVINYLRGLKDWNISRQIPWGIAIPMFHRADLVEGGASVVSGGAGLRGAGLGGTGLGSTGLSSVGGAGQGEQRVVMMAGASAEADTPTPSTFAPASPEWIFDTRVNLKEIEVGGVKYIRDEDTFDTWFSSSHWPIVCTDWEEGVGSPFYPLDVMETAADILFAWVARMIMMGLYVTGEVPFTKVYLHGLVLDSHGKKMSKSKGNVINPMEMIAKYGSDAFRLGILRGRSAGMAQAFSEQSVVSGQKFCNKLWNISRFIQGIVDEEVKEKGYSSADIDIVVPTIGKDDKDDRTPMLGAIHKSASDAINPGQYEYTTNNMGEDWICREINRARKMIEQDMAEYRFAEAVEVLQNLIWDKYADWFVESQKLYKNVPLLRVTLESLLVMLHPFAPFLTEAIWQNLSWTSDMIIDAEWPSVLEYDEISAENFERLREVVSEIRATSAAIAAVSKGKKFGLLYGEDMLVDDNSLLVKFLGRVPSIASCNGAPRGLRLALANHELYLDVPAETVAAYRDDLEKRILAVGAELDGLNARMMNPRYVEKAPAALVKETRDAITEKEMVIERLRKQLAVI